MPAQPEIVDRVATRLRVLGAQARHSARQAVGATGGAPRWVSGLLAGAQGALLSFLVVVVPTMAAYVATSADPTNADVGWPRSVAVGTALWLLGHGGVLEADGARVTLVPLGLTALAVFGAYASARRSAHPTRSAWLAGIGGYVAAVGLATAATGTSGPIGAGPLALLRLAVGTTLVAALGLGAGMTTADRLRQVTRPAWRRVPGLLRTAAVAGTIATGALVALAAALTATWVVQGRAAAGDVVDALGLDLFGGALLAAGQAALAPNLVLWATAWWAGPGFAVGEGTRFAPAEVVSGPMPALPLLGALPTGAGGWLAWAPLAVVACGALAGWWLHRRLVTSAWWHAPAAAVAAGTWAGTLAAGLTVLAGGGVGPGRLAVVGADPPMAGLAVTWLVALGCALVLVPFDAHVRAAVGAGARGAWAAVTGRGSLSRQPADRPGDPSPPG